MGIVEKLQNQELGIKHLFDYGFDITEGRNVSCMDWNSINTDLLAVSYGEYKHDKTPAPGLLMFWTLKNPQFPERIITTQSRITTCHFSKRDPSMIAIGDYDGGIGIYDLRKPDNKVKFKYYLFQPVAESKDLEGKHTDTVTEVQWINKGVEKGEVIISIGADGKVIEWSMKKGLDYTSIPNNYQKIQL